MSSKSQPENGGPPSRPPASVLASPAAVVVAAVVAGGLLRLQGWGRSLGHDEVFTWARYASKPVGTVLSQYDAPNNHILHSLAVKLCAAVLGTGEEAIRLAALAAGVAAIALVAWWVRRSLGSAAVGAWAGALVAFWPAHVQFSQQARGYTLVVLGMLCLVGGLGRAVDGRSRGGLWWYAGAAGGAAAVLSVPSALFGAVAVWCWALALVFLRWRRVAAVEKAHAALAGLLGAAAVAAVYLPLWEQLQANSRVWGIDVRADPARMLGIAAEAGGLVFSGRWPPAQWAATALGLALLARRRPSLAWLCAAMVLVPAALTAALGTAGPGRVYFYMLPAFALPAAYGAWEAAAWLAARWRAAGRLGSAWLRAAVLALFLWGHASATVFGAPSDPHYAEAGEWIVKNGRPGDLVVVPYIMDSSVNFYSKGHAGELVKALFNGTPLERLYWVARPGTPRYDFDAYLLITNFVMAADGRADDKRRFDLGGRPAAVARYGTLGVYGGRPVQKVWGAELDDPGAWALDYATAPQGLRSVVGAHPLDPARRLTRWESGPEDEYILKTVRRFVPPADGVAVLLYSKSAVDGAFASLFEDDGGHRPLQMAKTQAVSMRMDAGPGRCRELAESYLLPVKRGRSYGVYVVSRRTPRRCSGDWGLYYMPW